MVVYVRLYGREGVPMSVRPLKNFLSPVEVDGQPVARFQYVGSSQPAE